MKKLNTTGLTAALLGLALATSAAAQQTQDNFPRESTQAGSCADVDWNKDMLKMHPGLINACQEVVVVEGETWARFAAKFVRVNPNGNVIFSVRDKRDRSIEDVVLVPTSGQVAYIEDRPTPFGQLRTTDKISLYVPEGQYGFATQPGVPKEQLARVVDDPAPATYTNDRSDRMVAQRDATPRRALPATASPQSWLALTGLLSLLGGMVLTSRRWS